MRTLSGLRPSTGAPRGRYSTDRMLEHALTDAERNYTTTEKECLPVVWSILTLRLYLYGSAFNLGTDQEALGGVLNLADSSSRLARWRLHLA